MAREKICGIYKIENLVNGKVYVGQSVDVACRRAHHLRDLRCNVHANNHLQRAYNLYGADSFSFNVIVKCDKSDLNSLEVKWIEYYREISGVYNQTDGGGTAPSEAARLSRAKSVILLNTKEIFPCIADAIKATGARSLYAHLDGKCRYAGVNGNGEKYVWMYLADYYEEQFSQFEIDRIIQLAQRKLPSNRSRRVICLNNRKIFGSLKEAANFYGITPSTLNGHLKHRSNSAGVDENDTKLIWSYVDEYELLTQDEINSLFLKASIPGGGRNKRQVINLDTKKIYSSVKMAATENNIKDASIIYCCQGKYKTSGGFHWMYYDEYQKNNSDKDTITA